MLIIKISTGKNKTMNENPNSLTSIYIPYLYLNHLFYRKYQHLSIPNCIVPNNIFNFLVSCPVKNYEYATWLERNSYIFNIIKFCLISPFLVVPEPEKSIQDTAHRSKKTTERQESCWQLAAWEKEASHKKEVGREKTQKIGLQSSFNFLSMKTTVLIGGPVSGDSCGPLQHPSLPVTRKRVP
jgi:hypothetical protein